MKAKIRRYQSPVTPPHLITPPAGTPPSATTRPMLSLLGGIGGSVQRAPAGLISFSWAAPVRIRSRR
jgi:hypothetical protein